MTHKYLFFFLLIVSSLVFCKSETNTFKNFGPNAEDDYIFNPKKDKIVIDIVQNDSSIEGDLITICGKIKTIKGVVKVDKILGSKIELSNCKVKKNFILKYHICDEENDSDVGYVYGIYK